MTIERKRMNVIVHLTSDETGNTIRLYDGEHYERPIKTTTDHIIALIRNDKLLDDLVLEYIKRH